MLSPREPADLSAREARFVAEFLVDLNGAAAARRAGYSPKTAAQQASRLRHKQAIRCAIQAALNAGGEHLAALRARLLEETAALAFADARELWDQEDDGQLRLRRLADLTPETAAALGEVSSKTWEGGAAVRARLHGKVDACKLLAKLLGVSVERLEFTGRLTVEEATRARESLRVKLGDISLHQRTAELPANEEGA